MQSDNLPGVRAYLAGKVTHGDQYGRKWEVVASIYGHEFVASDDRDSDGNHGADHGWSCYGGWADLEAVKERFVDRLAMCDVLIAYLDDPTSFGSIAEIAWASATNKAVLVVMNTSEQPIDKVRGPMQDAYWFVCSLPNVQTVFVHSEDEATDEIRAYCRKLAYRNYLASPEWKAIRADALRRSNHQCGLCPSTQRLQVHHRHYQNIGSERPEDLIVLCEACHKKHHGAAE